MHLCCCCCDFFHFTPSTSISISSSLSDHCISLTAAVIDTPDPLTPWLDANSTGNPQ